MRFVVSLLLVAAGCSDYVKPETAASRAKLEEETHLTFFMPNQTQADDAVVRVVSKRAFCSGALVSDAIVITAEHCVTDLEEGGWAAVSAGYVRVEIGSDALPWGRVGARHVLTCDGWQGDASRDVAAIVLERRVPKDVARLRVKMGDADDVGKDFIAQGFGTGMKVHTMPGSGSPIWSAHRVARTGTLVWLGTDDFALEMPTAHGDSGGPVIEKDTNEVVGVTSAGREHEGAMTVAARIAPCSAMLARAVTYERTIPD